MSLYVSGPMSNLPDNNFPAFHAAAQELREAGYTVINPAEIEGAEGDQWADFLRRDLRAMLAQADGIVLLTGWSESRGSRLEITVARALSWPVGTVEWWLARRPETLEVAK